MFDLGGFSTGRFTTFSREGLLGSLRSCFRQMRLLPVRDGVDVGGAQGLAANGPVALALRHGSRLVVSFA